MSQLDSNLMVHQLPSDCYPPTDSDDESFVVLERSLAPNIAEEQERKDVVVLSPEVIDQTIEIAADMLLTLSQTPTMPEIQKPTMTTSFSGPSIDMSYDEIQRKVVALIEENNKLKTTLQQNNLVMKNQYETLIQWQKDVDKVQESHKKKFSETKAYIKGLQTENARLVNLLRQQNTSFVALPDPALNEKIKDQDDTILKLAAELEQCRAAFEEMERNLMDAREEASKSSLSENVILKEQEEIITKLSLELVQRNEAMMNMEKKLEIAQEAANKKLSEQELEFDNKKQNLLEQITALKVANEGLIANLGNTEELERLKSQLMAAQVALTNLKQSQNAEKEAKTKEIKKLESLLLNMNEYAERNEVLEQQLQLYKTDFETERDCKNKAIIDKNQLMEDLQNMQRRNHELLDEVENLRSKCTFVEVGGRQTSAPSAPQQQSRQTASTPSPPLMRFTCPLCMVSYRSLHLLEQHVENCINNSGH